MLFILREHLALLMIQQEVQNITSRLSEGYFLDGKFIPGAPHSLMSRIGSCVHSGVTLG